MVEEDNGLDWAQGRYDSEEPPEPPVVGTCALCGRDIYKGEKIYKMDDDWYCTDCVTESEAGEDELLDDEC